MTTLALIFSTSSVLELWISACPIFQPEVLSGVVLFEANSGSILENWTTAKQVKAL